MSRRSGDQRRAISVRQFGSLHTAAARLGSIQFSSVQFSSVQFSSEEKITTTAIIKILMSEKNTMNYFLALFLGLTGALFTCQSQASDLASRTYTTYVNKIGEISLPENYRLNWGHLGSWAVNDPKAPGYGFHDVYTQPEVVKAFRETGQFPDGAVLIKEVRKMSSRTLTTGPAVWAGDTAVWFVMIKDIKGRFKDNANWEEGWGWALFEAENRNINCDENNLG